MASSNPATVVIGLLADHSAVLRLGGECPESVVVHGIPLDTRQEFCRELWFHLVFLDLGSTNSEDVAILQGRSAQIAQKMERGFEIAVADTNHALVRYALVRYALSITHGRTTSVDKLQR